MRILMLAFTAAFTCTPHLGYSDAHTTMIMMTGPKTIRVASTLWRGALCPKAWSKR